MSGEQTLPVGNVVDACHVLCRLATFIVSHLFHKCEPNVPTWELESGSVSESLGFESCSGCWLSELRFVSGTFMALNDLTEVFSITGKLLLSNVDRIITPVHKALYFIVHRHCLLRFACY